MEGLKSKRTYKSEKADFMFDGRVNRSVWRYLKNDDTIDLEIGG